jgi:hypothetical protein
LFSNTAQRFAPADSREGADNSWKQEKLEAALCQPDFCSGADNDFLILRHHIQSPKRTRPLTMTTGNENPNTDLKSGLLSLTWDLKKVST